jgi:glycine hydroxymethyltransferase
MHIIAAKAVAFKEALQPSFKEYQKQIVANAKAMAEQFIHNGINIVSGGTDNHLMLLDLTSKNITGRDLEILLDKAHITVNKNAIPFDKQPHSITSGIRVGTPSVTTRGMKEKDCMKIADLITAIIDKGESAVETVSAEVKKLCDKYPIYANDVIV